MTSAPSLGVEAPDRRPHPSGPSGSPGPFGRLGAWSATHARTVFLLWVVVVAVLGAFAPKVESALSGAGLAGERLAVGGRPADRTGPLRWQRLLGDPDRGALRQASERPRRPARHRPGREHRARRLPRSRPWCRRSPARRSVPTGTPRSSWPGPRRIPTRWCAPPTTSRDRWQRSVGTRRHGERHRRVGAVERLQQGQPQRDDPLGDPVLAGDHGHPGAGLRIPGRRRDCRCC